VGLEFAPSLVKRANQNAQGVPVIKGDVRAIPVPDGAFSAAYTSKVLQCLSQADRPLAVAELFRVTASGGVVVLFEKIRGGDGSSFEDWIGWATQAGGRLVACYGNHFAPLDRLLGVGVSLFRGATGFQGATGRDRAPPASTSPALRRERYPVLFAVYAALGALTLRMSLILEPFCERLLPKRRAEHAVIVFEKL
jgi:SAM-dependent methyltransferase